MASGEKIAFLFYVNDGWVAISKKDKDALYLEVEFSGSNPDEYAVVSEEELYQRIPFLRGRLKDEEGMFVTIDYDNGKVFVNPLHKPKNIFIDSSVRATNQANFEASAWTYIRNNEKRYLKVLLLTLFLIFLSVKVSWGIVIFLFWFLFYTYYDLLGTLDNYHIGTLNAAVVISKRPTRIAVFTDASKGLGYYPLVRVCKMKLPKRYNNVHERIPSSCGYYDPEDQPFWDYIMPNPLVYGTNDEEVIREKIKEIPNSDWIELNNWVRNNEDNFFEGYYPIRNEKSDWDQYESPKFTSFNEEKKPAEGNDM